MKTTRERALDAAVDLVGSQGIRALTHTRVDAQAGLPRRIDVESTSAPAPPCWPESRSWITEQEIRDIGAAVAQPFDDARRLHRHVQRDGRAADGPATRSAPAHATRCSSRRASDPDLFAPLRAQREGMYAWIAELLVRTRRTASRYRDARVRWPSATASSCTACSVDPDAPVRASVAVAVRGCLST